MKLRGLRQGDLDSLQKIHEEQYPLDDFPNLGRLNSVLVICDDNDNVVSAGGVELIAEGVLLTDKTIPAVTRVKALIQMLAHMKLTCAKLDQNVLHAFVSDSSDEVWMRALELYKFESSGNVFHTRVK